LEHPPQPRPVAQPRRCTAVAVFGPTTVRTGGGHVLGLARGTRSRSKPGILGDRNSPPVGNLGPECSHFGDVPVVGAACWSLAATRIVPCGGFVYDHLR